MVYFTFQYHLLTKLPMYCSEFGSASENFSEASPLLSDFGTELDSIFDGETPAKSSRNNAEERKKARGKDKRSIQA